MNFIKKYYITLAIIVSTVIMTLELAHCKPIIVYEIDSGVDLSHQYIKNHVQEQYWDTYDFTDDDKHGTHIAGIILKGTCEEVELRSCRYFNKHDPPYDKIQKYLDCLEDAIEMKPDVINISSGGQTDNDREYTYLKKLKDIPVVCAAGNDSRDIRYFEYYPAGYNLKNVTAVGNLDMNLKKHETSNYGKEGMVWEMGTQIYSTLPNGKYGYMTGTSMSAAKRTNRLLKRMCRKLHERR